MEVTVYGQLRGATGAKTVEVGFDGGTVREAIEAFIAEYPRAERHLYQADGTLEPSVRLSRDGKTVETEDDCPATATLTIHPAMQGG